MVPVTDLIIYYVIYSVVPLLWYIPQCQIERAGGNSALLDAVYRLITQPAVEG